MRVGLWKCIRAAFSARPLGMPVPPNWIAVAGIVIVGMLWSGVWLIGAGLELGYLLVLAHNERFQQLVTGQQLAAEHAAGQDKLAARFSALSLESRQRYQQLEQRCRAILTQQNAADATSDLTGQREGLNKLLWIYLSLLGTREAINRLLQEAGPERGGASLEQRLAHLEDQLKDPKLSEELRKSLSGQRDIVQQRIQGRQEASDNLAYIEAELQRIQDQVELIREQAVLASDPAIVSNRIDQIGATLGTTSQWIRDRQQIYGTVEDLIDQPPPLLQARQ